MGIADNPKPKRKGGDKYGASTKNSEWSVTFIKCELSAESKKHLEQVIEAGELAFDDVLTLVAGGYKFSLSHDSEHGRFVTALTCKSVGHRFWNYCISASGSTAIDAVYALLYKHYVLLQSDWSNVQAVSDDRWS